jgi:hypothetical protein
MTSLSKYTLYSFIFIWFLIDTIEIKLVIINTLLLLNFYKHNKNFLTIMFLFVTFTLYFLPVLVNQYFDVMHLIHSSLSENGYRNALLYILAYNIFLISTYSILKLNFKDSMYRFLNFYYKNTSGKYINLYLILLFLISLYAKYYLHSHGAFVMLDSLDQTQFLQLFKALSGFNIAVILLYGYYLREYKNRKYYVIFYFLTILISLYLAIYSASRSQIVMIFIILIYGHNKYISRHIGFFIPVFIGLFLALLYVFPVIGHYRIAGGSLIESIAHINQNGIGITSVYLDILSTRLNYIDILARVVDHYTYYGDYKFEYYQNIVALVPRFLWEGKPLIGIDYNSIGHQLSVISANDTMTQVGLGVIGESFSQMKFFGVVIGMFHGLLFFIINKFRGDTVASYILYLFLVLFIVSKDGFVAVFPGLISLIFPLLFILFIFNKRRN